MGIKMQEVEAGPALNALVAEHVMGWVPPTGALPGVEKDWDCTRIEDRAHGYPRKEITIWINMATRQVVTSEEHHAAFYWMPPFMDTPEAPDPFDFSGSLTYAWQVVRKLNKRGYLVKLWQNADDWGVSVWNPESTDVFSGAEAPGRTAPEALCRAALQAVAAKKEEVADA